MSLDGTQDAALVEASLSGDREAFGQIVARYQSLICALGYSATGSVSQSEDLAQETFLIAWRQLRSLREPGKLQAWLCGIARHNIQNARRRQGREPTHAATALDEARDVPSPQPPPPEEAMSHEEQTILWRAIEQLPELYREPLVLFYRSQQSVQRVAAGLELSEDAVKQRLSRGRKLLHEQVLALVENALARTNPGQGFTLAVLAALPAFTVSTQAATLATGMAKGGATVKAMGASSLFGALLTPAVSLLGTWMGYRMSLDGAQSEPERAFIRAIYARLVVCLLAFGLMMAALLVWGREISQSHPRWFAGLVIGLGLSYALTLLGLMLWMRRRRGHLPPAVGQGPPARTVPSFWDYRSRLSLFGAPFVHIRFGGNSAEAKRPVKAWVAVGPYAVGRLVAIGAIAVAPVSIGGFAVGVLPFGGFAFGLAALGGMSLGVWSAGGLAFGWEAYGGFAVAWQAAMGGVACARAFALGGMALAAQANSATASQFFAGHWFFQAAQAVVRQMVWLQLLWLLPMLVLWRRVRAARGHPPQEASPAE